MGNCNFLIIVKANLCTRMSYVDIFSMVSLLHCTCCQFWEALHYCSFTFRYIEHLCTCEALAFHWECTCSLGMYALKVLLKYTTTGGNWCFFFVSALFLIGGRSSRMGSWSHSICNTSVENNLNYHQGFINTLTPVVRKMVEYTFPKFVKNFKACLTIL